MKAPCFVIVTFLLPFALFSQTDPLSKMNIGVGAGIDYGGFGARYSYQPFAKTRLFAALGYNLNDVGYNVGGNYDFFTINKITTYLTLMYGYNAVLLVEGLQGESRTTYYGPSGGVGIMYSFKNGKSFFNVEVLLPLRPAVYHDAIHDLQSLGYQVEEPLPVAFSLGYHINIFQH